MEYKTIRITHQKILAFISASVFLIALAILLVFSQKPEFPEEIPSAEKLQAYNNNYFAQKNVFNQYTKFIRDNHGGITIADEKTVNSQTAKSILPSAVRFRHQYNTFNKRHVFDLTNKFALENNISYRISASSQNGDKDNSTYYFEVEFLKNKSSWIVVEMEVMSSDMIDQSNNQPLEKSYTQDSEPQLADSEQTPYSSNDYSRLIIVIDDLGNRMDVLRKLISLDYDITYSVLPQQQFSLETADTVFEQGREVMLHLPMEPKEYPKYNPGLGALLISDTQDTIIEKLERNLETVPYAVGINNHMGSAFTQHDEGLDIVMQVLSGRMLFFLDSKTAPGRIAKRSARDYRVPYLSRDIFLDNNLEVEAIGKQLMKAARIASRHGKAIAIGHPHFETYQALAKYLPEIEARGIQITRISDLLNQ